MINYHILLRIIKSTIVKCAVVIFLIASNFSFGQFTLQNAFPNLSFSSPLFLANADDNTNRIFVVEQAGRIKVFPNNQSASTAKEFLNITDRVVSGGEMGLLGLAFHPDYETNGYFYVNYTTDSPSLRTVISRFQVTSNPDSADKNSEIEIITFSQPYGNHNGGWIGFGPDDGYLYIATGDGGDAGDPQNYGQRINTLLGKILCIDVDGATPYAIPTTNPFYDSTGSVKREIYAWGLRNPWRCSFDPITGWLWAADVGQYDWEEIDIIENGKNYGWRCYEGNHPFNTSGCNYPEYIFPIWEYPHGPECSVTGGYVYRGNLIPELTGKYIYGDYCSRKIWSLEYDGINPPVNAFVVTTPNLITSFGVDELNEIYITLSNGNISRFTPTVDCIDISISPGWNLLSVPYLNIDMSASNIFPNSSAEVFGYSNGYYIADSLQNGAGYWVKYDNNQTLPVCGSMINTTINVNVGWNLIGPFDAPVPVQSISSSPPNIIVSSFFGYDFGYEIVDTLNPGSAYWVKTNSGGTIQYD
jgi:glucose/arabinose dehydrogenase